VLQLFCRLHPCHVCICNVFPRPCTYTAHSYFSWKSFSLVWFIYSTTLTERKGHFICWWIIWCQVIPFFTFILCIFRQNAILETFLCDLAYMCIQVKAMYIFIDNSPPCESGTVLLFKDWGWKAVTLLPSPFFLQLIPFLAIYLPHRQLHICTSHSARLRSAFPFFLLQTDFAFSLIEIRLTSCVINREYLEYKHSHYVLSRSIRIPGPLFWHMSNLICIIGFSQLWNSFDLPPSLVTEWDRQGVPLTSHMFTLSLLFYTLASFLSCMCFISSTDTQIYQSLTLHLSFFISSLQFVVITLLPAVVVFAAVSRVGVARLSLEFPVWLSHI